MALFVTCTIIWLASGAHGPFWPVWLALVSVIPLLRNGWRLYGPAPELDRVAQELARRERHLDRRGAPGAARVAATVFLDVDRADRAAAPAPVGDP